MTNEDIIGMAVEAGFADAQGVVHAAYQLEAFANLVAAHEQLRCADLVTDMGNKGWDCFSASAALLIRSQS